MKIKSFIAAVNRLSILSAKQSNRHYLLAILALTFLVYFKLLFKTDYFYFWDDDWYIFENDDVISFSFESIKNIFTTFKAWQYSPIPEVYHAIIYAFFGENVGAFTFFALLNHLVNTFLLFKILERLTKNRLLIIFVPAIFALHPMQVETLGWLSVIYRLAVLFHLLGIVYYLKYMESGYKIIRIIPVVVFFILGLLTKEIAVLFPVALLAIHLFKGTHLLQKRFIVESALWIIACIGYGTAYLKYIANTAHNLNHLPPTFYENAYNLSYVILSYFKFFLFPFNLSFWHPTIATPTPFMRFAVVAVALLLISLIIFGAIRNKYLRLGSIWAFGFLIFALTIPLTKIRPIYLHDHYIYFSIIGFAVLFVYSLSKLNLHFFKNQLLSSGIIGLYLLIATVLSFNRVDVFKNEGALWGNAIERDKKEPTPYINSIRFYGKIGELKKAKEIFSKAISLYPNVLEYYYYFGRILANKNLNQDALKINTIGLKLSPNSKKLNEVHAVLNQRLKNHEEVVKTITKLLNKYEYKKVAKIRYLWARAEANFVLKNYTQCLKDNADLIALGSDNYENQYLIGHSNLFLKKYKAAEMAFTRSLQLNENQPMVFYLRSVARFVLNKHNLAFSDASHALQNGYPVKKAYIQFLERQTKSD